ncbi:MAG TPA: hypothetical protein VIH91_00845 [Terriglobales bacterium]
MELRTCDHLKEDGIYCKSPALRGRDYCYFHLKLRGRRLNMARARALGPDQSLDLPFPEDMYAVQISLGEVLNRLAHNQIDPRQAGLMLYTLQQAATNLNNTPGWQGRCQPAKPDQPLFALEFPDFEQHHHLPEGVDLEADPEVALPQPALLPNAPPQATTSEPPAGENQESQAPKAEKRRADRVPLPKPLWTMKDPDAPFRAYTSDGRELTRQDAERWQKRIYKEMQSFIEHGGEPDWTRDAV